MGSPPRSQSDRLQEYILLNAEGIIDPCARIRRTTTLNLLTQRLACGIEIARGQGSGRTTSSGLKPTTILNPDVFDLAL
jgi:hypothetical protein